MKIVGMLNHFCTPACLHMYLGYRAAHFTSNFFF